MAVTRYRVHLLDLDQCKVRLDPDGLISMLKDWRKSHSFDRCCKTCGRKLKFHPAPYTHCCGQFYYDDKLKCYTVHSIAVPTPGYVFMLPQLQRMLERTNIQTNQEFLVFPDPIFWQVTTTLVYEKILKFIKGLPVTFRTKQVYPPSKSPLFYKQLEEAPLNYGSLSARSCGKATLIRQIAFGKRCILSMRGMIVPDSSLRPNQIRVPDFIVHRFQLRGKWIILNRMPTLQPGNIVALQIPKEDHSWPHDCFGIPLEIIHSINGDFDGDEINIYMVPNLQSQAECACLLNSEWEMGCFVMGLKLAPSQDMLVAYHLFYDEIDFLPYKNRNLQKTFRVIYELYGSKQCFEAVDNMRRFYLSALNKRLLFALTLEDMHSQGRCFKTQIESGAKGSFEHLKQMFDEIGQQGHMYVKSSFWSGLTPLEAVAHANVSHQALSESGKIWQPGYGYTKIAYNVHDIKVDYLGRLMDGNKRVIEQDVLDAIHHTDVMLEDTFQYLIENVLKKKRMSVIK